METKAYLRYDNIFFVICFSSNKCICNVKGTYKLVIRTRNKSKCFLNSYENDDEHTIMCKILINFQECKCIQKKSEKKNLLRKQNMWFFYYYYYSGSHFKVVYIP